jgi:hypothetical protein
MVRTACQIRRVSVRASEQATRRASERERERERESERARERESERARERERREGGRERLRERKERERAKERERRRVRERGGRGGGGVGGGERDYQHTCVPVASLYCLTVSKMMSRLRRRFSLFSPCSTALCSSVPLVPLVFCALSLPGARVASIPFCCAFMLEVEEDDEEEESRVLSGL